METEETHDLIKSVIKQMMKVYKGTTKWDTNNKLKFTNKSKKKEGELELNDLKVKVTGVKIEKLYTDLKNIYTDAEKNKVKDAVLTASPFKCIIEHRHKFNDIELNPKVFDMIVKEFKDIGIEEVLLDKYLGQNATIFSKLKLLLRPHPDGCGDDLENGYKGRLRTFLFGEKYCNSLSNKDEIVLDDIRKFSPLNKEKIVEIKDKDMLIGHYYPERNLIGIYFNPFEIMKVSVFDDEIPSVIKAILKALKDSKVKQTDVSSIQEKIFVSEFMKGAENKLKQLRKDIKSHTQSIESYEKNIRQSMEKLQEAEADMNYISTTLENKGVGVFQEIIKVKKLPFVEKVEIESGKIDIKFIPTFCPSPTMIRHDGGREYGKTYFWVGSVGFKISASDFRVYGDVNIDNHCHPHGSFFPEGGPCFGDGDGRRKIYSLLATNKFTDLAKMLWFWIKTYRNSGAYIKVWNTYDSLLSQGYPIFDKDKKRIEINDPERIKTKEQVKLTKKGNYKENFEKFKDIKLS